MTLDENAELALPPSIELMWGLRERQRRGPKPGLSLDRIVAVAVELADTEGLAALSMSRLAEKLGFTTMSLYRYVSSKDELLTLMQDAVASETEPPEPVPGDWRAGLAEWTWKQMEILRGHNWTLQLPISGPPMGPANIIWMEAGLKCMADTGLHEGEKLGVIMLLSGYGRSQAIFWHDLDEGQAAAADLPSYGQILAKLVDPRRFPAVHAVVASGVLDGDTSYTSADFNFGLDCILDGVEKLIEQRS